MSDHEKSELAKAASSLYENIKADIANATTRVEHIRITTLAQEAENLYNQVLDLVRTKPGSTSNESTEAEAAS